MDNFGIFMFFFAKFKHFVCVGLFDDVGPVMGQGPWAHGPGPSRGLSSRVFGFSFFVFVG